MIQPYPLVWPETMPRWKSARQPGQFKTTLVGAMENVRGSLRRFGVDSGKGVTNLVISSNVTLGINNPSDPGVAIWFNWDGLSVCIPVDRYAKVEANLQAIHHVVEARRTELRHGTLALVRATFSGFVALPPPPGRKTWRDLLGLSDVPNITDELITERYRERAKKAHPDQPGGSNEAMSELSAAKASALLEIGR